MKKMFSGIAAALLAVVLFTSCSKNHDTIQQPSAAGIMGFNLVTDRDAGIGIALSGNYLTNVPITYAGFTGAYLPVYPGSYNLQAFDVGGPSSSGLTNTTVSFAPSKYYSVFVTGNNSAYSNVVTEDNYDSLSASTGQAYVRYVNAIADSSNPRVTISANGSAVVNEAAHYQTVSRFTAVTPGQVAIAVTNDGNIQSNRTITLEAKKAYTVLLMGVPGSTDATKAVQIRFVTNGTLN